MTSLDVDSVASLHSGGGMDSRSEDSTAALVQLGPESDFDWETYILSYTGRTRIDRLLFMASRCPQLRKSCSDAALDLIQSTTTDVTLYHHALTMRNTSGQPGLPLLPLDQRKAADSDWCNQSVKRNQNELEKLEVELRHYQNNLIKESVRMAHRDLGDHLRSMGNLGEALKYYIKTRDHCSTSEHVVEMCINVIEVSLELGEYHAISAYVSKAEGLLESYNPTAAASSSKKNPSAAKGASSVAPANKGGSTSGADAIGALFRAGGSAGTTGSASLSSATAQLNATVPANQESEAQGKRLVSEIRSKLNVAQGIAYLGMAKYELAKSQLLEVDLTSDGSFSNMASRADVAMYLVLCSLSVLDRPELKSGVLDRPNIAVMLEWDSQARDILEGFYACEYKKTLDLLEKIRTRNMLDIHLAPHYATLVDGITRRALRQYIQPFDSLRINRMATSLGWLGKEGEERTMDELISLIQNREIDGKLDVIDRVYYANRKDARQALFDGALQMGQQRTTSAKRLVMRMNLIQSNLIVRSANERIEP